MGKADEIPPRSAAYVQDYADDLMARFRLPSGGQVVEIGSNDGALLRAMQEKGCRVLGVEAERDTAIKAWESGIDTLPRAFTADLARDTILEQRGVAVMVIANDILATTHDLSDLLTGVRCLLTPGGLFVFEVPYPGTVKSLLPLLRAHDFELIEALHRDHRLRGIAKVQGGPWPVGPSVAAAVATEEGHHE